MITAECQDLTPTAKLIIRELEKHGGKIQAYVDDIAGAIFASIRATKTALKMLVNQGLVVTNGRRYCKTYTLKNFKPGLPPEVQKMPLEVQPGHVYNTNTNHDMIDNKISFDESLKNLSNLGINPKAKTRHPKAPHLLRAANFETILKRYDTGGHIAHTLSLWAEAVSTDPHLLRDSGLSVGLVMWRIVEGTPPPDGDEAAPADGDRPTQTEAEVMTQATTPPQPQQAQTAHKIAVFDQPDQTHLQPENSPKKAAECQQAARKTTPTEAEVNAVKLAKLWAQVLKSIVGARQHQWAFCNLVELTETTAIIKANKLWADVLKKKPYELNPITQAIYYATGHRPQVEIVTND